MGGCWALVRVLCAWSVVHRGVGGVVVSAGDSEGAIKKA